MMLLFKDYHGNEIELTNERWQHIVTEHPEVKGFKNRLLEILGNPDFVTVLSLLRKYSWWKISFGSGQS